MIGRRTIYCFSQSIDTLERLKILNIFERGNLKQCLMKELSQHFDLIIVLLHRYIVISVLEQE